jgi:hypothetical protein
MENETKTVRKKTTRVAKKVTKKATKVNAKSVAPTRATITLGQAASLVKFYEKNNAKVPAFLAKLV